jgi:lipoprotein-releasing system ATP-binding protein
VIRLENLSFAYGRRERDVISDVDLVLLPGQVTVITGRSGCGKSTLLYLLGLMLTPRSGEIVWAGHRVGRLSDAERSRLRARQIGFVFQDALLDPSRSVIDNVVEGGLYAGLDWRRMRQRAAEMLTFLGVDVPLNRRPGEISGGQAQRVALGRALLKKPHLILADEPTGNLDPASANVVWDTLSTAASDGASVVIATHDVTKVAAATKVLTLA